MAASKTRNTKVAAPVTMSSVYATYAQRHDIDTTAAGKRVRSRLRANFAKVCELDANVAKAKTSANDGNRWPKHVTPALADFVNPSPSAK